MSGWKELSARAVLDLIEKRVEEMRESRRCDMGSDERDDIIRASAAFDALTDVRRYLDELRGRGDV